MELCGPADRHKGYGILTLALEIVAERMHHENDEPSACFPLSQWAHHLYCHHHAVTKYFKLLVEAGFIVVTKVEGNLEVTIPDLNEWADEFTARSRRDRDKLRNKRGKKTKEEQTKATALPADFRLPESWREIAQKNCPYADVERCFAKFLAHARSNGKISVEWDAEWELWTLQERVHVAPELLIQ